MKEVIEGWIARDQNAAGYLGLYIGEEPLRDHQGYGWWQNRGDWMSIPKDKFPDLKWEDEPRKVKITIETIE